MQHNSSTRISASQAASENPRFFAQVMTWMAGSFLASAVGIFLLGPLIPPSWILPLSLVMIAVMVGSIFVRLNRYFSGGFALLFPLLLSAISYPTLNYYVQSGSGDLVVLAALGALVIFGGLALWGWTTPVNVSGWGRPLFFVTLGLIAMSVVNLFLGLSWLGLLIAFAVLAAFSLWTVYDMQQVKRAQKYGTEIHPAVYALSLWLDLWNIFMSLLRIFSAFR